MTKLPNHKIRDLRESDVFRALLGIDDDEISTVDLTNLIYKKLTGQENKDKFAKRHNHRYGYGNYYISLTVAGQLKSRIYYLLNRLYDKNLVASNKRGGHTYWSINFEEEKAIEFKNDLEHGSEKKQLLEDLLLRINIPKSEIDSIIRVDNEKVYCKNLEFDQILDLCALK